VIIRTTESNRINVLYPSSKNKVQTKCNIRERIIKKRIENSWLYFLFIGYRVFKIFFQKLNRITYIVMGIETKINHGRVFFILFDAFFLI